MPDHDDIPRRRRVLVLDVTQAAAEVSRLTREAYELNLPVELVCRSSVGPRRNARSSFHSLHRPSQRPPHTAR